MKTLLLMRHASAEPGRPGDDLLRPLDAEGRREASRMASHLSGLCELPGSDLRPELALCSPAVRARETLDSVCAQLSGLRTEVDDDLYLASPGGILSRAQDLPDALDAALVVGHNPGLAALARSLPAAGEGAARVDSFPPGCLAVLRFDAGGWADLAPGRGRLVALARPSDLE